GGLIAGIAAYVKYLRPEVRIIGVEPEGSSCLLAAMRAGERIEENLSAAWQRLSGTYVENLPWLECAERYDRGHTFHYMDPPYWQT
ncbi:pyridoxal-phosphate dependent enzyme, partial [Klebsiella pneumoniae]|uniref:pyridoxal-phosphate dependent enzyme n=1 Tax=Klebsiella pneumoniae TaxID=573 RepID=UPI002731A1C7